MMEIGRQSKNETRTGVDDEAVKPTGEVMTKMEDVIDATPKAESASQVQKVAMNEYCLARSSFSNQLESMHKLETDSALHQNVKQILPDLPYNALVLWIRLAPLRVSSARSSLKTL